MLYVVLPLGHKPRLQNGFFGLIKAWWHARDRTFLPLQPWVRPLQGVWEPVTQDSPTADLFRRLEGGLFLAISTYGLDLDSEQDALKFKNTISALALAAFLQRQVYLRKDFHVRIARAALDDDLSRGTFVARDDVEGALLGLVSFKHKTFRIIIDYFAWMYYAIRERYHTSSLTLDCLNLKNAKDLAEKSPESCRLVSDLAMAQTRVALAEVFSRRLDAVLREQSVKANDEDLGFVLERLTGEKSLSRRRLVCPPFYAFSLH